MINVLPTTKSKCNDDTENPECNWILWLMVDTLALHLAGLWFKSQSGDWLSWLRFHMVFLSPSRQMLE
jgi:hypothetical protein